jgi:antitoxin component YwqK of YwqJK toxin-antitoxin module
MHVPDPDQKTFFKAVKVDEVTGLFISARGQTLKQEFSIGGVYSVPGEPKLCHNGFHACPAPLECFNPDFGYDLGRDVLLEVEFLGPQGVKWSANRRKLCGCTLRVLGLATVKVNERQYFQDGLFFGRVHDFFEEVWYAGNKVHREDDLPAKTRFGHSDNPFREWYKHGVLHRDGDLPAVDRDCGLQQWYKHGVLHRDGDLPAEVWQHRLHKSQKIYKWYQHGVLHREGDEPAYVEENNWNGSWKMWFVRGLVHREGDMPAVMHSNGFEAWMKNGLLHREGDHPAKVGPYGREWYRNGKLHREGGLPASIARYRHTERLLQWYRDGEPYREGNLPTTVIEEDEEVMSTTYPIHGV